jgi:hypothetical protein
MLERRSAVVAAVATVVLGTAGAAHATTYRVSGEQVVDDAATGKSHMTGGLVGQWAVTTIKETAKTPLIRAKGRERFTGCIDRARDGSCDGDPTGTLRFTFQYWAQPGASAGQSIWGACLHPIVSGTGGLKGARGVVTMVDTPTAGGATRTDYLGNVTLGAPGQASARAAAARC